MPTEWNAVSIGAVTLVVLNCLVCLRIVFATGLTAVQKLLQVALVWLIPLLGMLLVYVFHQVDNAPRGPAEPPFGGGAGGPPQGAA